MRRGWGQVLSRDSTLIRLAHQSNRSSPGRRTTTVVCLRGQGYFSAGVLGCWACWGTGSRPLTTQLLISLSSHLNWDLESLSFSYLSLDILSTELCLRL